MASGKSTLGRALGARPGFSFVDLDAEIERAAGMSVAAIFAACGEADFRRRESAVLRSLVGRAAADEAADGYLVVACGGGTPCHADNMELMNSAGTCVLLEASDAVTLRRLREAPAGQRPLVDSAASDAELLDFVRRRRVERAADYERARFRFCSDRLESEEEIAEAVERFVGEFCNHAPNPTTTI